MDKKFTIYSVCDVETGKPLTIVRNRKQVNEYIDKFVKAKNFQHFSMWCELRNLDANEDSSWRAYVQSCKPDAQFVIKVGKVPLSALFGSFRTACGCLPLGMPWELDAEMASYTSKLPDEIKGALQELENLDVSKMSPAEVDKAVRDIENRINKKDAE